MGSMLSFEHHFADLWITPVAEHALVGASDFFNLFSSLKYFYDNSLIHHCQSNKQAPQAPPSSARSVSHRAPTPAARAVWCDSESSGYGPISLARGGHGRLRVCASELERRNEPASPPMSARAVSDSGLRGGCFSSLVRAGGLLCPHRSEILYAGRRYYEQGLLKYSRSHSQYCFPSPRAPPMSTTPHHCCRFQCSCRSKNWHTGREDYSKCVCSRTCVLDLYFSQASYVHPPGCQPG